VSVTLKITAKRLTEEKTAFLSVIFVLVLSIYTPLLSIYTQRLPLRIMETGRQRMTSNFFLMCSLDTMLQ
jgi:hypothetical protein